MARPTPVFAAAPQTGRRRVRDARATRHSFGATRIAVAALVAVMALTSCAALPGASTPRISSVALARAVIDFDHVEATTMFAPSDRVFHAVVTIADPAQDGTLYVKWYRSTGGQFQLLYEEQHKTYVAGAAKIDATVTIDQDWPVAAYRIAVSLDTGDSRSLDFEVR